MDKQKQIEEMAKIMLNEGMEEKFFPSDALRNALYNMYLKDAENLYNAGYRKITENAVVLTREEYEALTSDLDKTDYGDFENGYSQGYEQARKETAEKFAERVKSDMKERDYMGVKYKQGVFTDRDIDEICKEITEGKV